ncbi:MAG: type II toxin-antitoxin system HicA family toxin [Methanospirillum sp.]
MASALPLVAGAEIVRALQRAGFEPHHRKGSHVTMKENAPPFRRVVVPMHDPVRRGTLRAIIRDAGLTVEEFVLLL